MRELVTALGVAAAFLLAACVRAPEPAEPGAVRRGLATHCEAVRESAEPDSLSLATMPADAAELAGIVQDAAAQPRAQTRQALTYEAACGVLVSDEDRALRRLVSRYLDLNQNGFGGIMIRAPGFNDAIVPLREGSAHIFRRPLRGGVAYRFIGACDNECNDLDLIVTNAAGEVVVTDVRVDNFPVVELAPEADGDYFVALYLHTCAIEPCYVGMRLLERRDNWALPPFAGTLELTSGAFDDPQFIEVMAGGEVDMSQRVNTCVGFVSDRPDARVNFSGAENGYPLLFSVHSQADTTLVINGPDGRWHCGDDGGVLGRNPLVRFDQPLAGQYDIWVGQFDRQNELAPARLAVSQQFSQ